jgi:hypothetical protein
LRTCAVRQTLSHWLPTLRPPFGADSTSLMARRLMEKFVERNCQCPRIFLQCLYARGTVWPFSTREVEQRSRPVRCSISPWLRFFDSRSSRSLWPIIGPGSRGRTPSGSACEPRALLDLELRSAALHLQLFPGQSVPCVVRSCEGLAQPAFGYAGVLQLSDAQRPISGDAAGRPGHTSRGSGDTLVNAFVCPPIDLPLARY